MIRRIARALKFRVLKQSIGSFDSLKKSLPTTLLEVEQLRSNESELKSYYQYYVKEISRADMAVSLQLATLLLTICKNVKPGKLLDLGSGFSSFVFRKYAKSTTSVRVVSVDDDVQWLSRTHQYLDGLLSDQQDLLALPAFVESKEGDFDIVLLDLNFVEVRKDYIRLAVGRCKKGGIVIFDDTHKPDFLFDVLKQTRDLPISLFDVAPVTRDQFGRYALLGVKK